MPFITRHGEVRNATHARIGKSIVAGLAGVVTTLGLAATASAQPDTTPAAEDFEPNGARSVDRATTWLDRERDAAWTAKLAILRLERVADILHLGACLRGHESHIAELAEVARTQGLSPDSGSLREPSFVTGEPHVIGALIESGAVLAALESIETARVARYPSRGPVTPGGVRPRTRAGAAPVRRAGSLAVATRGGRSAARRGPVKSVQSAFMR